MVTLASHAALPFFSQSFLTLAFNHFCQAVSSNSWWSGAKCTSTLTIATLDLGIVHSKSMRPGVSNLVAAVPLDLKRFVFVSSCGVERKDKLPYSLLNTFGVLDAKQKGELAVIQSGLPYTIIRPGRLIDGPFTSSDLNTLLKATTGGRLGIVIGTGDTLTGQTSRIDVAAARARMFGLPNNTRQSI